jgi:hypothetical protein
VEGRGGGRRQWIFNPHRFRHWIGEGSRWGTELVQESEGGRAVLQFSSIRVREGGRRWHVVRRCDGRAAVALVAEGRRWPGDGPAWAEVDHTGRDADGPARKIKKWAGLLRPSGRISNGLRKILFTIFKQRFEFKIKDSNAFKPNLNWSKLGINLK